MNEWLDVSDEDSWLVSCLGTDSLDSYKASKFSFWVRNMMNAFEGCAAAFLPEIKRGHALCNMYDSAIFGSELVDVPNWQVSNYCYSWVRFVALLNGSMFCWWIVCSIQVLHIARIVLETIWI